MFTAEQVIQALEADARLGSFINGVLARPPCGVVVVMMPIAGVEWETHVRRVVAPLGWYVTRDNHTGRDIEYFLESQVQSTVPVRRWLYHASPAATRSAIASQGLVTSSSSSGWTKRRYHSPRVHLSRTLSGALGYIESSVTGTSAVGGITGVGAQHLSDWDIYLILRGAETFHADVELEGDGVWTTSNIPTWRVWRISRWVISRRVSQILRR